MMATTKKHSVLIVEDDTTLNRLLVGQLNMLGYDARGVFSGAEARAAVMENEPDLALLDHGLPDVTGTELISWMHKHCPVIILTAHGSINLAVKAIQAGALDFLVKPVPQSQLELSVRRAIETATMRRKIEFLETKVSKTGSRMVGSSKAFRQMLKLIDLVTQTDTTVLIDGESGTGKELVAESIHARSKRASSQFVTIDCCTLQENLLESELFGHERGSFTGAERKKEGLIEVAEGGTVFLDEIGEISPAIQAKLLRVLETNRFRRLGGTRDISANVRFVAATNRSLLELAQEGKFRNDLYYRLTGFIITVPPLRERAEDIVPIAEHFLALRQFQRTIPKSFSVEAKRALVSYSWPGNIRELRNVVERGLLMSGNESLISDEHLALPSVREKAGLTLSFDNVPTLDEVKATYISQVLNRSGGNKAMAAKILGISERSIYRMSAADAEMDG